MSQTPNPHDPYGTEPSASVPPQTPAPHEDAPSGDMPAPTSDPALHPHDPFALDPSDPQQPAPDQAGPAPQPGGYDQGASPGAGPAHANAQQTTSGPAAPPAARQQPPPDTAGPAPQPGGYDQGASPAAGPAHANAQQTTSGPAAPPADLKGVHEGALSGQPVSDSDARLWSLFAHLSAIIGYIVGVGFLGWLGPLIIFLVYKDRDRYVRYNAAEALNAAIAVAILSVVLWIGIAIIGVITLGIGFLLSPIAYIPAVVHCIFAIVGAVKSNQGAWWNYPVN